MSTNYQQMAGWVREIVEVAQTWAGIEAHLHRFGGTEFRLVGREIGHIHRNGMLDIPFNRALKAQLLAEGKAEVHHLLTDSGWISFYIRSPEDVSSAVWLLQLAYVFTARTLQKQQHPLPAELNFAQWIDHLNPSTPIREILEK